MRDGLRRRSHRLGIVALLLTLPGVWIAPAVFFAAWLTGWWLCLGLILGALGNAWIHRLTGGRWGAALRPATAVLAARMPWVLLFFLPLALGLETIYPWAGDSDWQRDIARPAFVSTWLSAGFFFARMLIYAIAWWWLARPGAVLAMTKARAAASLIAYGVLTSLAAVDLLMSLTAGWYSTAFGLIILGSQMLGGGALTVLLTVRCAPQHLPVPHAGDPPVTRDLGNLLLMWLMTWAYVAFMQFLVIWAENLPREISWYVPRLQTGWQVIGLALVVFHLALPLVALLFRPLKDNPQRLAALAAALVTGHALYVAWLVLPSVAPHSLHGWWLLPLSIAGMALLFFGGAPAALRAVDAFGADGGRTAAAAAEAAGGDAGAAGTSTRADTDAELPDGAR